MTKQTSGFYDKIKIGGDGQTLLSGLNYLVGKLESESDELSEFSAKLYSIALRVIEHGADHKSDLPSSSEVRYILSDAEAKKARKNIKVISNGR